MKSTWARLSRSRINGTYVTDVARWTCDCGSQKYHPHLLCKHLVQSAGPIPDTWWREVTRYHIPPFYTVPIDGRTVGPPESLRDHSWLLRIGVDIAAMSHVHNEDAGSEVETNPAGPIANGSDHPGDALVRIP